MKFLRAALALLGVAVLGGFAAPTSAHALSTPQLHVERGSDVTAGAPVLAVESPEACDVEEARELLSGAVVVPLERCHARFADDVPASSYTSPTSGALHSTSLPARK